MSELNPENPPLNAILDLIDAEMPGLKQPKVLLFDIGGVCVVSPFQAILDYELSLDIPPGWVNYSISRSAPNGYWHKLERGDVPVGKEFFKGFNSDLHVQSRWEEFYQREQGKNKTLSPTVPTLPRVDGEWLFNAMINVSLSPDPWMYPALRKLEESGKYILGALSNTIKFPPGHPLHQEDFYSGPIKSIFDVFISSAHVRLRKPDPKIYQLAITKLDEYAKQHAHSNRGQDRDWESGVAAPEILFLDDIGENLKAGREEGFQTIKVHLGRTYEAVEELEKITGLQLEGDHPKIPVKPRLKPLKAKV